MHKIKCPPSAKIFSANSSLELENYNYAMLSSDHQTSHSFLDKMQLHTALIKLSPYAKTFYTEWLLEPDGYQYNMLSADQILRGHLDVARLRTALNRYVLEHVLLSSHIQVVEGEPHWVANDTVSELDYSSEPESEAKLLSYVQRPFDVYSGPLYRFKLIRLSKDEYRLIVVLHHLVMDGISLNEGLFDAISNYYNNPDYTAEHSVAIQIELLTELEKKLTANLDRNRNAYLGFWQKQLAEVENIDLSFLHAPSVSSVSSVQSKCNPIAELKFNFEPVILDKLTKITAQYQITPYIYSQCIFAILLHKYTSQARFAISYPVAIKEGAHFIYGSQVNLNLLTYHFTPETTLLNVFNHVRYFFSVSIKGEIKYGYYPIYDILQAADNNSQLLQLAFEQAHFRDKPFRFFGIEKTESLRTLSVDGATKDTIIFEQDARRGKLDFRVKFDRASINEELLQAFIDSYKKLFVDMLDDVANCKVQKLITDYSLLSEEQYQQLVYDYNHTTKYHTKTKTIHQVFEERVVETPNNIALVYEKKTLTYQELNKRANQLARYISHQYSVQPDDLIALCLDKTEHVIITILAIFKCGAAYVPIDPHSPIDRIQYIVEDTDAKTIFINEQYKGRLDPIIGKRSCISLDNELVISAVNREEPSNLALSVTPKNLAYVIYTSGTTGQPKGVLQPHNNVLSLLDATEDLYQFNDNDVWLLFHSYVFDFTVWEIWGALIYGGKLIIPNKHQIRDFAELHQLCKDTGVTVLNQTPSAFYQFSEAILKNNNQHLSKLRYIIFGGEKLNFSGLASWFNSFYRNKPQLFNMYGITELTVLSTFKIIKPDDLGSVSCIGKILPQQTCYVLDSNLSILPLGAIGELHIGGERLAKGYLNQPMLTKERFIPNPFQTEKEKMLGINSQLYKTGDLVRLLLSGDLEYITRNDSQVKIRGYRIELGAIEATLTKYPGITQAVVLLKTDSDRIDRPSKYLVAYYRAKKMLDEIKIRDYLARHLNSYMCPTVIIYLNSFPLTVNGKIDIKSLPTRKFKRNIDYVAPSNIQEQLVCEAFSNLLGVNPVGVTDDFFELGGDSLKAITLTARLQTYFAIKVIDIFNFGTPKNIAKRVLLSGNVLKQRLNEVKQIYRQQKSSKKLIAAEINQQEELYLAQIKDIRIDAAKTKNITYVLLTGATGYLGCHLLYQLLKQTDYTIFILIRANTNQEAKERIRKKYKFYFEIDLADLIEKRIFILKGDLELPLLGLTKTVYEKLASRIDSIMHAAALVKHYGAEEKFYSANVQATINLLGFSKLTILKDFHYISTTSVLNFDSVSGNKAYIGTENNAPENLVSSNNIYVKTKLQAECQVVKYRDYGINSNIYRVGNLTINSENCCSQENLHENAFANWLDGLLSMQCIAAEISTVEMSQVDLTAKAIVKLFDREQLVNDTYHIFNPNLVKLTKIFPDIKTLSIEKFVDNVARKLLDRSDNNNESLLRFVLRQGWLEKSDNQYGTAVKLLQSKTAHILQQLNFRWPSITKKQLNAYLEQLRKT